MSNIIQLAGRVRIYKPTRRDLDLYNFGGCPACHRPFFTDSDGSGPDVSGMLALAVGFDDYCVCEPCGVFWLLGCGHFGSTAGEERERNIQKLQGMREVEPWFPDMGGRQP